MANQTETQTPPEAQSPFNLREGLMGEEEKKQIEAVEEGKQVENAPESTVEQQVEQEELQEQVRAEEDVAHARAQAVIADDDTTVAQAQPEHSKVYIDLKQILDDELDEYIKDLPDEKKKEIWQQQQNTLNKLEVMVTTFTFKANEVLMLIATWLRIIPGVSKYFLMQDAKIKSERVIDYAKRTQEQA